jgi:AGCS family alanine or glycine:cation symporter
VILLSGAWNRPPSLAFDEPPAAAPLIAAGGVITETGNELWSIAPARVTIVDPVETDAQMREGAVVFVVIEGDQNAETGANRHRVFGELRGSDTVGWTAEFDSFPVAPGTVPRIAIDGVYLDLKGATLTAKAFDRVIPGLGIWVVPITAWLFAFSTIISWSYYGEQGIVYLLGRRALMPYRVVYCALIMVSVQLIRTQDELDLFSTFGTGVMLWVNVPIMLIFAPLSMREYRDYFRRLDAGQMRPTRGEAEA